MDTRELINLRVLQQHDKCIRKILKQSPYVVLYSYSLTDSSWSKLPFEGTLFVYETDTDQCGYVILNRISLDCFSKPLMAEEDVTETEGYVIHKCEEDIWGIWIWDSEDRMNIYRSMRDAARSAEAACAPTPIGNKIDGATTMPSLHNNVADAAATAPMPSHQVADATGTVIDLTSLFGVPPPKTDTWTPSTLTMT